MKKILKTIAFGLVALMMVMGIAQPALASRSYYTNSSHKQVHVPVYRTRAPAGSSAECRDGSYSYSQHRQGTCSRHGGVATWL